MPTAPKPGKPIPEKPTTVVPGRRPVGHGFVTGRGLVARITPIKNVTGKHVLKSKLYLPCVLNTLTVQEDATHNEYTTVSSGEYSQPGAGGRGAVSLQTIELDTLTLTWDAKWLVVTYQDDREVRNALTRILRSRHPVMLMINTHPHPEAHPEVHMPITFRSRSQDLRPGENDTRYMTFQVSQWRDPTTGRRGSAAGQQARKRGVQLPTTAKLMATDTLSNLSYAYYGTYANWRYIRDANGISHKFGQRTPIVSLKGKKWTVGAKIKIPAVAHVSAKGLQTAGGGAGSSSVAANG